MMSFFRSWNDKATLFLLQRIISSIVRHFEGVRLAASDSPPGPTWLPCVDGGLKRCFRRGA